MVVIYSKKIPSSRIIHDAPEWFIPDFRGVYLQAIRTDQIK